MMVKKVAIAVLLAALLPALPVLAVPTPTELTVEQIGQVGQSCKETQSNLQTLQKGDTVLRINRGRLYDMTLRQTGAFLSRLELHKIESTALKEQETAMRNAFRQFIANYDLYGDSLEQSIAIDCQGKPLEFYGLLHDTMAKRQAVAQDVSTFRTHTVSYTAELQKLQDRLSEGEAAQ